MHEKKKKGRETIEMPGTRTRVEIISTQMHTLCSILYLINYIWSFKNNYDVIFKKILNIKIKNKIKYNW